MAIAATGSTQCQILPHRSWRPSAQPKLCTARCKQLSCCNRPTHRPKRSCNWRIQAEEASADSNSDAAAAPETPAPRDDDVCLHHQAACGHLSLSSTHSSRRLSFAAGVTRQPCRRVAASKRVYSSCPSEGRRQMHSEFPLKAQLTAVALQRCSAQYLQRWVANAMLCNAG